MPNHTKLQLNVFFILLSMLGGFIFSCFGAPIPWLLGSLTMACLVSSIGFKWRNFQETKEIHSLWRQMGQTILGIELGQNFHLSIISVFENHFMIIFITLLSTIALSILSGIVLWRFTPATIMTSLFSSTPGGISAMPSIAEEAGANALVVSIIQTLRILLVVGVIPILVSSLRPSSRIITPVIHQSYFNFNALLWTACLIIGACAGALIWKKLKMPSPWLIGSILGVIFVQLIGTLNFGDRLIAYWPHQLIIFAQVLIGTSIGSRISSDMFKGLGQIIFVSFINTLSLVILTIIISFGISEATHIPLITCILAFAPGGIAEMSATAISLHADSTFVLAVQSIRLLMILILLPTLFRIINKQLSTSLEKETINRTN
jgi:membrane AbrB-like protein